MGGDGKEARLGRERWQREWRRCGGAEARREEGVVAAWTTQVGRSRGETGGGSGGGTDDVGEDGDGASRWSDDSVALGRGEWEGEERGMASAPSR